VGGGFGGLTLAKKILDNHGEEFDITLVDKKDYQLFHPALFKVVSSLAGPSELFSVAAIKFPDIFKKEEITILKKEVENIFFDKNQIIFKSSLRGKVVLNYDYLVLASGSESDFKNAQFAESNALPFKTFEDALKIKEELGHILKNKAKREDVNVAVIGGGATGCGLVSFLYDYVHKLASSAGHPHKTINFKLFSGGGILPGLSPWSAKTAGKILEKMGVEIFGDSYVKSVEKAGCVLSDGTFVGADIVVWAGGVKPNGLVEVFPEEDRNIDRISCLKPTQYLRARGYKNIFVIGDVAYPGRKFSKEPLTAQTAIRQAKYVARSLAKMATGKKIGKPYRSGRSIYVVEMGEKRVFVDIGPLKLTGRPARFVRRHAFLGYLKSIMPSGQALVRLKKFYSL